MALLIKNGEIVTADARYRADIVCEGRNDHADRPRPAAPAGAEVIDATGKFVFPGFIDPHVHIYLPFMGTFAKDTYETASRAALVGGTTTLIEMVCPSRADDPLEAYELWKSQAAGRSACDYAFHMGVTRFDDRTPEVLAARSSTTARRRSRSFSPTKARSASTTPNCIRTLELARRLGVIVTAHCENAEIVAQLQQRLLAEGKTGPGVARAVAPAGGRGRGRASPGDLRRADRRPRLRRAHLVQGGARRGPARASAASACGSKR